MAEATATSELPVKATETGTIFWISIGLGTVASLPLWSGVAEGTVSIARGAMWFLVTTLIAMVGVWTISWLMHVFSDPYPDDATAERGDDAQEATGDRTARHTDQTPMFEDATDATDDADEMAASAMSETP